MNNPLLYLQQNALLIPQGIAPVVHGATGIAVFDLRPMGAGQTSLIPWAPHPKSTTFGWQRPMRAYWLPYAPGVTRIRALGAGANLMFTPQLDGCFIGIGGALPTVAHVAGDIPMAHLPATLVAAATAAIGAAPARQFDSNPATAVAITFVGVRNPTTGAWTFYAQGNTGNVGHLTVAGGIVLEHVYNAAPLATAQGFPGQHNQHVVTL